MMDKKQLQTLVDILEESFEEGHNNETYKDCVLFAEFLMEHGITITNMN